MDLFDFNAVHRLCDPYITTTILEDTFGELAHEVASKYLVEYEKGRYRLREEYFRCCSSTSVLKFRNAPYRKCPDAPT